ncbi:MAG: hypothetical protein RSB61_01605 [Clostridia bacterium]
MWRGIEIMANDEFGKQESVADNRVGEKLDNGILDNKVGGENSDGSTDVKVGAKTYKCANCGNFLAYDPTSGKLKCYHCNSLFDIQPPKEAMELNYSAMSEQYFEDWGEEEKVVKCNACGATIALNKYETTMNCPFCSAPNIVEIDAIKGLKPNAILPFKIGGEQIHSYYAKWLKSKIFAPYRLRKDASQQALNGVYIPLFTFDARMVGSYKIRYGEEYTVTVGSGKNARTEVRVRWYVDSGQVNEFYDDIQVECTKEIDQKQLGKLGGFDTKNCVAYHSQYVAGYSSERYSEGLDDSWEVAKQVAQDKTRAKIIAHYHADRVDYLNIDAEFYDATYKYALVPTWLIKYKYHKKIYGCVINGRNGKSIGKYPLSPWKVGITGLVGSGILAGLIWLVYMYFVS